MEVFEEAHIGSVRLKNRIIRSATFEGAADPNGFPTASYYSIYKKLATRGVAAVITGFTYILPEGRAMHPGQAGCDSMEKLKAFSLLTEMLHEHDCKAFLQIAHTGRQTLKSVTGAQPVGVSAKKSAYFNEKPLVLTNAKIYGIIESFGRAAFLAKKAGFDGVQLHAAHGYLIHQFLLSSVNNRVDEFEPDPTTQVGTLFLQEIIENIRHKCGNDFPILVKISASDDYRQPFSQDQFMHLIRFLDEMKVSAIEISYGTMDAPFNIFRGDFPEESILAENGIYKHKNTLYKWIARKLIFPSMKKKFFALKPMYNLPYALLARQITRIPLIVVGGFRSGSEISHAIRNCGIDFVSMCRPFIAEPDLVMKLKANPQYESKCISCNQCAVMCDSSNSTRCYTHINHESDKKNNSPSFSEKQKIITYENNRNEGNSNNPKYQGHQISHHKRHGFNKRPVSRFAGYVDDDQCH
jgi:2,4-dienoyl-CoA reductase-like NADH-dependent reductase (Old Yellow Enzyme family)